MLNTITIMGRLTATPELKTTRSGTPVTSFTLAVERDFKGKESGERVTDFIDCVAWRGAAEFITRYFTKGRMAIVNGRLEMRGYTDKDGNKRRAAEVIAENVYFGDSKNEGRGANNGGNSPNGGNSQSDDYEEILGDDDLPF